MPHKKKKKKRHFTEDILKSDTVTYCPDLPLLTLETHQAMSDLTTCYKLLNHHNDTLWGNNRKLMENYRYSPIITGDEHVPDHGINLWNKLPDSALVARIIYTVLVETLNPAQSINQSINQSKPDSAVLAPSSPCIKISVILLIMFMLISLCLWCVYNVLCTSRLQATSHDSQEKH